MKIQIRDFPGCCTAMVLCGLSGTATAEYGPVRKVEKETIKKHLSLLINAFKKEGRMGILTATTNNNQETANQALRELGFKHSRWCSKKQHPNTKVRLWWLPVNE